MPVGDMHAWVSPPRPSLSPSLPGSIQLVGVEEGDTMPVGDSDHVVLAPSHGVGGAGRVVEPIMVVHLGVDGSAGDEAGRPQSVGHAKCAWWSPFDPARRQKTKCVGDPHSRFFKFLQNLSDFPA